MPMTMIRRPRAVRRMYPAVLNEVRNSYRVLGAASIMTLADEISSWDHQPRFSYEVSVAPRKWRLTLKWDRRTKSGMIYDWVSTGTGERGDDPAGKAYEIVPKKAKALGFHLPMVTKTTAASGAIAPSALSKPKDITTQIVHAPGIYPRHLGEALYKVLKSRDPGSFHNITEAAIKRAFRKLGIYVG